MWLDLLASVVYIECVGMVPSLVNRLGFDMRVHINDWVEVDCVEVAGSWNGWARPLFTRDQLDGVRDAVIRGGLDLTDMDGEVVADPETLDMTTLDYVVQWGELFEVCGWVWEQVGEGN